MFYFQVYGNLVEKNIVYQQLQKLQTIFSEKVCRTKFFGQIWANSCHVFFAPPKNCQIVCSYNYTLLDERVFSALKCSCLKYEGFAEKTSLRLIIVL